MSYNPEQNIREVSWREKYRVRMGAILGFLFIWRAQPTNLLFLILGLLAALAGILLRQWAAGCLIKNDELATQGPYAIVRNPLYLGSFLAAAGCVLTITSFQSLFTLRVGYFDRSLFFWAGIWVFMDSVYLPKIRKEEVLLHDKFREKYSEYAERVPAVFPKLSRIPRMNFSTFSVERWKKNKEYGSLIGFLVIALFLLIRYHFSR